MSTDPELSVAVLHVTCLPFFFFCKKALGLSSWQCNCTIRSQHVILLIPTRAAWRSFFKFPVGYFRDQLFPVRANGSSELACRQSNTGLYRLIKTDRRTPAPTTTVDVQRTRTCKRIHQPHPIQFHCSVLRIKLRFHYKQLALPAWKFLYKY